MKKKVNIRFQNGLSFSNFKKEVLAVHRLLDYFEFVESEDADFVVFGPYGNDIPLASDKYVRIGYFCENITPDLSICDWGFGIPREEKINAPNYFRIQWHGFDPCRLIKREQNSAEDILKQKTKFCNFIYSSNIPYRERFFERLSKYKKVDSPGRSMNNMPSFDSIFPKDRWEAKRQFQAQYKFTLAIENYFYPGYQTEKLYDSMLANSIPVYIGDPYVKDIFNTKSFISFADEYEAKYLINRIEDFAQLKFIDILPTFYNALNNKISRKVKSLLKDLKMKLLMDQYQELIIEKIISLDKSDEKYIEMHNQPWLNNNQVASTTFDTEKWIRIFNSNE